MKCETQTFSINCTVLKCGYETWSVKCEDRARCVKHERKFWGASLCDAWVWSVSKWEWYVKHHSTVVYETQTFRDWVFKFHIWFFLDLCSLTILFKPLFTSTLIWELPTTTTAFKKKISVQKQPSYDVVVQTSLLPDWRSWFVPQIFALKKSWVITQFFCHILDFHLAITIKNSKKFHPLRLYFLKMEKIHHSRNTDKSSWLITVLER